jgi:biotin operon repressor
MSVVRKQIPAVQFVLAYNASQSEQDVASQLGLKISSVKQRASGLRKQGANVKKFPDGRGGKKLDIEAINEAIAAAAQGS